jgi:hypothetical protein
MGNGKTITHSDQQEKEIIMEDNAKPILKWTECDQTHFDWPEESRK